jgi:hypothetical protein
MERVHRRERLDARLSPYIGAIIALALASFGALLPGTAPAALPDGRVYEQVSPANKNGNTVGNALIREGSFGLAADDGDAAVFVASGALGTSYSSTVSEFVARRTRSGWVSSAAIPREQERITDNTTFGSPLTVVPSHDFSRFLFGAQAPYVSAEPLEGSSSSNIFLSENPAVEPAWVAQPTITNPIPALGADSYTHNYLIAGGTPDFSTVYFTYSGTLVPADASRAPLVGDGLGQEEADRTAPWGLYEWSGPAQGDKDAFGVGTLRAAGVLPDGTLDPYGAVPAAVAGVNGFTRVHEPLQAQVLNNEVSSDGSRVFFVSPDPVASTVTNIRACEASGQCTHAAPELYVRETTPDGAKRAVLVSKSAIVGHEGEPAPNGPMSVENAELEGASYVYASSDGSQAFFVSTDFLTKQAEEDNVTGPKEYDFDVDTGSLTYLPGVVGPILVSAHDGSSFIFKSTASQSASLDLWTRTASGGMITKITELPVSSNGDVDIDSGRASTNGSVFVFRTDSPLAGGFNNVAGFMQVYRYEVATSTLNCVSCLPSGGVTPTGDVKVSYVNRIARDPERQNGSNDEPMTTIDTHIMSSGGSRVFFDTPDPLVPADTNGKRDVYEWEASGSGTCSESSDAYSSANRGCVYLISSGKSVDDTFVLDASVSGEDVFFTTDYGLVSGDTDNAYDIYDARVPRPGDTLPPTAGPCQGDICQGPPSVPSLLGAPPSAIFNGAGNLVPVKVKTSMKKATVKKGSKKCAKGNRLSHAKCVKSKGKKKKSTAKKASADRRAK